MAGSRPTLLGMSFRAVRSAQAALVAAALVAPHTTPAGMAVAAVGAAVASWSYALSLIVSLLAVFLVATRGMSEAATAAGVGFSIWLLAPGETDD